MAGKRSDEKRKADPYLDRRSGEDRRKTYDIDYFTGGGAERRTAGKRRSSKERRKDCVKVSQWSSVCPRGSIKPTDKEDSP